ncbi:acyltransferase family protein [Paraburkholderia fungorum]|uniref:acyltransferase family protein n=1 Tax=Paraburkholderia fungorum TaxID=134537 RepID=UPI003877CAA4
MNISGQKRQDGIQALRAFACALVVLQHVTYFACDAKSLNYQDYLPIDLGQIGVGIFFVISGYVMGLCMGQGRSFLWNRAVRIYPPYWIAIALSAAIFLKPASGWTFNLGSALLLPTSDLNTTYRIPYWTLCYEMAFYAVTYALVLTKATERGVKLFCIAWFLAIVTFNIYHHTPHESAMQEWLFIAQPGKWILLSPYSAFFAFGLLISATDAAFIKKADPHLLVIAAAILWLVASSIKFDFMVAYYTSTALSYCLILVAMLRTSFGRLAAKLGDFSYGCYLIHILIIVAVESQIKPYAAHIRLSMVWVTIFACAAAGGCAYGWIEHKIHSRFTKIIFASRSKKTPERAASAL